MAGPLALVINMVRSKPSPLDWARQSAGPLARKIVTDLKGEDVVGLHRCRSLPTLQNQANLRPWKLTPSFKCRIYFCPSRKRNAVRISWGLLPAYLHAGEMRSCLRNI